jgi:hypothetical protein
MLEAALIQNINQSWLYFLSEAFADEAIDLIYQTAATRTENNSAVELTADYVIASPINEWRVSQKQPETLEANFRIHVVTGQEPGEILKAHSRNLSLQILIQQILFGPERYLEGSAIGGGRMYVIPLRHFSESGDPEQLLDSAGIQYGGGNVWNDRSLDGADIQRWTLEIPVSITR